MRFPFKSDENRKPEARSRLAPGCKTSADLFDPFVRIVMGRGPAVQDLAPGAPKREAMLAAERDDCLRIDTEYLPGDAA